MSRESLAERAPRERATRVALVVAVACAFVASSVPPLARAQTAAPRDAARALFDEAVALMQDGRYLEALERLERARALRETPAVVYNLAVAQRGLGRYIEAVQGLERYLELAGARVDPARRAEIEALLGELRAGVASVRLRLGNREARVSIDGVPVDATRLAGSIPINPGRHTFRAEGTEMVPDEVTRNLEAAQSIEVVLEPRVIVRPTTLGVEATAANAAIYVNRRRVGTGAYRSAISPGRYQIEVRAVGYVLYSASVRVAAGETQVLRAQLERVPSVATRWWFWTGLGLGVAAVAAVATTAVVLSTAPPDQRGTWGITVEAVRGSR